MRPISPELMHRYSDGQIVVPVANHLELDLDVAEAKIVPVGLRSLEDTYELTFVKVLKVPSSRD